MYENFIKEFLCVEEKRAEVESNIDSHLCLKKYLRTYLAISEKASNDNILLVLSIDFIYIELLGVIGSSIVPRYRDMEFLEF